MKNVIITGGGTGGHFYAALSFADYIKKMGYNPIFIGSIFGIEQDKLKDYDYEYFLLKTKGFAGKTKREKIISLTNLFTALFKTLRFIRQKRPVFSIGFGGYTTLPVIMASKITGAKTAIVEQNSIAGKANKFLSKFADFIFVNFHSTKKQFKHQKIFFSGNPIRRNVVIRDREFRKDTITIGVLGGSRGSKSINKAMMELARISDSSVAVIHQTGADEIKTVQDTYKKFKPHWIAYDFIDDMHGFYQSIDFIICRAGAGTLSEIACASLGSLLIPYPYAIYNHQYYNAMEFVKKNAAILTDDKNLSGKKIESIISLLDKNKLRVLSENAKSLCVSDACERIFKIIQQH